MRLNVDPIMVEVNAADGDDSTGDQGGPGGGSRSFFPVKAADDDRAGPAEEDRSGHGQIHFYVADLVIKKAPAETENRDARDAKAQEQHVALGRKRFFTERHNDVLGD